MRRRPFSLALIFMAVVLIGTLWWQWDLLQYGWMQGKGQLTILQEARPIHEVIADPNFPDSLQRKLILIQEVKNFAVSHGFAATDNYETLYDQKGKTALWNLSACAPFSFVPYQWTFPFLGTFSYKGFFDLEKAQIAQQELKELGYDTRIRSVSAWSTLGWFRDPIMSNMLYRSDGQIAETILHELTHGTIFYTDSLEFNENLASFVGEQAAIQFLKDQYGDSSSALTGYLQEQKDAENFTQHILRGKDVLDSLYTTFQKPEFDLDRDSLKLLLLRKIVNNLDTIDFYRSSYKTVFEKQLPNNAYFMMFQRYHSGKETFENVFAELNGSIPDFLHHYTPKP